MPHPWTHRGEEERRGTYGTGLALVAALVAAGVALGDVSRRFVWQAWHLVTSTLLSCGWHGTYGTGLALVAALVAAGRRDAAALLCGRRGAFGDIVTFAWQVRHLRHWAGSGACLGANELVLVAALVAAGRREAACLVTSTCAAGVALTALGWLWWLGRCWSPLVAVTPRLFCVAGMVLGDISHRLAWQTFLTHGFGLALVAALVAAGCRDAAGLLCGKRGAW
eukprot:s1252_g25.t1